MTLAKRLGCRKNIRKPMRSLGADVGRLTTKESRCGETARPKEKGRTIIKMGRLF